MLIGIVADDLTGAADAVAPFAGLGFDADVQWTRGGELAADLDASDARAWSTGTRDLPAHRVGAIRRLSRAACRRLRAYGSPLILKKIDSTLRGHLRTELDAMRAELPSRLAVVCPAFPANGRVVRAGLLTVRGDARGSVRAAFGMDSDSGARTLDLEILRSASRHLPELFQRCRADSIHTLFCDAEDDADLDLLASAILHCGDSCLPVGSAGLSAAIARGIVRAPSIETCELRVPFPQRSAPMSAAPALDEERFTPGKSPEPTIGSASDGFGGAIRDLADRHVIVFAGSLHGATRRQVALLAHRLGTPPIRYSNVRESAKVARDVAGRFGAGERVALVVTPDEETKHFRPLPGAWIYKGFLELAQPLPRFGLVLTGGDTAESILCGIDGCDGLRILGEMEPGIVVGRMQGSGTAGAAIHGLPIVLKAGGFGDDATLARCVGLAGSFTAG